MPKNKKAVRTFVLIAVFIAVAMACVSYVLLKYIRIRLEQDVKINLMEIAKQNSRIIAGEVNMDLTQLRTIGNQLIDTVDINNADAVQAFLKLQAEENTIHRLFMATPDGIATTSDGKSADISKLFFYKKTREGKENVSELVVSRFDGEDVYVSSVPLYKAGVLTATLHRAYLKHDFLDGFDISLFNKKGSITVINDDGDVIIYSAESDAEPDNNNYYRGLYLSGNSAPAKQIQTDLLSGQSGFVELTKVGTDGFFAAYTPITDVPGWHMISTVPTSLISNNANYVVQIFTLLLISLMALLLTAYAFVFFTSQKNKQALERMAFVDNLTGGNNFNSFLTEVPGIIEKNPQERYALIKFDIDNFKYINDMHGFDTGDFIIRAIYKAFNALLTDKEFLARGSGDNFYGLIKFSGAEPLQQRIADITAQVVERVGVYFLMSCGVCELVDADGNLQLSLDKAAIAGKSIKGDSKRCVALYTKEMSEKAKLEEEVKQTMQKALQSGEFEPFYQPKVNVYESKICGAEVLVRWRHPVKGLVPPDRFVPTMEKTGFVVDVDLYMFECVCKKLKHYLETGIEPIPISVNFSRVHLYNRAFISRIKELTLSYAIPPCYIDIELTESAIFDNMGTIISITKELQDFGFVLSMDDFGSGYSSLNMLKDVPINVIKIDKEFFGDSDDNARREVVIESIVEMAHKLNLKVVAEGIETIEQVNFLKKIGCTIAQGYYYSKPIPSSDFDTLYLKGVV